MLDIVGVELIVFNAGAAELVVVVVGLASGAWQAPYWYDIIGGREMAHSCPIFQVFMFRKLLQRVRLTNNVLWFRKYNGCLKQRIAYIIVTRAYSRGISDRKEKLPTSAILPCSGSGKEWSGYRSLMQLGLRRENIEDRPQIVQVHRHSCHVRRVSGNFRLRFGHGGQGLIEALFHLDRNDINAAVAQELFLE